MTNDEPTAIAARCESATPGPWHIDTGHTIWQASSGGTIARVNSEHQTGDHHPWSDLEFIAAARTDIPALLQEVKRLRAVCGAWTQRDIDAVQNQFDRIPDGMGAGIAFEMLTSQLSPVLRKIHACRDAVTDAPGKET